MMSINYKYNIITNIVKKYLNSFISRTLFLVVFLLLVISIVNVVKEKTVHAFASSSNSAYPVSDIPADIQGPGNGNCYLIPGDLKGICGLTGYDYNANPGYLSAGVNWISPQNDPSNDVSATVAPSASSVTLQFNSLDFAHHEISSNTAISCTGQLQPDSAGNPSCLALNDSQTGLNWGNALVETAGVIDSAVPYINANVSGGQIVGGSIYGCTSTTYVVNISPDGPCAAVNNGGYPGVTPNASPSGTTYKICSHNSTRYWGTNGESNGSSCTSSNPIAFNYIPNGGKWPSSPITIELNVKPANDFKYVTGDKVNTHADPYYPKTKPYVYQCVLAKDQISGHQPFLSSFSTAKIASVCPSANEFFTLNINNTPPS